MYVDIQLIIIVNFDIYGIKYKKVSIVVDINDRYNLYLDIRYT